MPSGRMSEKCRALSVMPAAPSSEATMSDAKFRYLKTKSSARLAVIAIAARAAPPRVSFAQLPLDEKRGRPRGED